MAYNLILKGPFLNAPKRFWFHIIGNFLNMELLFEIDVLFDNP